MFKFGEHTDMMICALFTPEDMRIGYDLVMFVNNGDQSNIDAIMHFDLNVTQAVSSESSTPIEDMFEIVMENVRRLQAIEPLDKQSSDMYDFGCEFSQVYKKVCACSKEITISSQKDCHPEYYTDIFVKCDCGRSIPFSLPVN